MKVRELKKRIEDLGISDDADVRIEQNIPFEDLSTYEPRYIRTNDRNELVLVIYDDGTLKYCHD